METKTFHSTQLKIKRDENRKVFILKITATNKDGHESDPDMSWKLYIPKTNNGAIFQSGDFACNQISRENVS